jgi:hypothetical protein
MTQISTMRGDKIYEFDLDITGVTDYGVSMDAILTGKETVPLQGARFDLAVDGRGKGPFRGGGTVPTIFVCALMVALTLTFTSPSRRTTAIAEPNDVLQNATKDGLDVSGGNERVILPLPEHFCADGP